MKYNGACRLRVAMAILLALTLSPLVGGLAFATGSSGAGAGDGAGSASSASSSGVAAAIADGADAIADPATIWDWEGLIEGDTASVGRIWTDKSVTTDSMTNNNITVTKADGSAFLTALTALSSTSNLSSTATTPLDIVLVLDASGSMDYEMGSGDSTTRIAALQSAANMFIDTIAKQNASISNEAKQHQVSLVKFAGDKTNSVGNDTYRSGGYTYNYSQVMKTMTACTESTKADFRGLINAIEPAGATNAAAGMELAQGLTSGRSDAKKIVIFFTDGTPTTASDWSDLVASGAVTAAKSMKDAGATVFSIGIFSGAKPADAPTASGVANENKFMHAVSSNYPNATFAQSGGWRPSYTWSFGDRAKDSAGADATYYKSAANASELAKVFEDISQEITKNAGYPTHTTDGYESTSGYITFNDQLGDYMEVTDLSTLIYDAEKYTFESKTTEGNVDTYHFSGKVNSGIGEGNLSDIIVTVTRSESVAAGDKVEVKIPATLIPLRHFEVDEEAGTMTVTDKTPITVFYSSALKSEVADLLVNPDDDMAAYIAKNTDKTTGKVNFYANKWNGGTLGDVTSQFDPSSGNSYYYITQDTPIFKDEDCTTRASQIVDGETYYYQHAYYALVDGGPKAKKMTETLTFPGSAAAAFEGCIGQDDDGCYFKAGTARLVYINQLHKEKKDEQGNSTNYTGTATDVLNPKWNSETSVAAATTVTPHLGNNGKLSVDKPATLKVSKAIIVPDGYSAEDYAAAEFTFELNVPKAANYSFPAVVLDANGSATCDEFNLTFDANGKATHTIKPGETLQVSGLGAGWTYTVTETGMPAGFTQTAPADDEGNPVAATGALAAGETAQASFTNAYAATGKLIGKTNLAGEKILIGRSWLDSDLFTFKIEGTGDTPNAPLPTDAAGNVVDAVSVNMPEGAPAGEDNPVAFNFGDITYDTPGTYYYKVYESDDDSIINQGVTASQAVYQVVVEVTDNHDGALTVAATKAQVIDDEGTEQTGELVPASSMAFTNAYEASYDYGANGGLQVSKTMTGRDLAKGEFAFTITGVDDASGALLTDADRNFVNDSARTAGSPDVMTKLAGVRFTQVDAGKTFTFEVAEAIPADVDKLPGVTYDVAKHTVKIAVADNGDGTLAVVTTVDGEAGNVVEFANAYKATNASYDTANAGLTKVLEGRDWLESDSFTFKLKAVTDGAPLPQDAQGNDVTEVTVTKNNAESFGFGTITFTQDMVANESNRTKVFEYEVSEVKGDISGIDYATNTATIKVTVTDDGKGALVATPEVENQTFKNTFTADLNYSAVGDMEIEKILRGHDMVKDQFTFEFSTNDDVSAAKFGLKKNTIASIAAKDGQTATISGVLKELRGGEDLIFTRADEDKTYMLYVKEKNDGVAGYEYDGRAWTVRIDISVENNKVKALSTVFSNAGDPPTIWVYISGEQATSFVSISFANKYSATGSVPIEATKELAGRPMVEGDFGFLLNYEDGTAVTGQAVKNDASGNVDFGSMSYDIKTLNSLVDNQRATYTVDEKGNKTWTIKYTAKEDTSSLPGGVVSTKDAIPFTVTVVDNGDGTLKATADAGTDGFVFKNAYGADSVTKALNGMKVLEYDDGLEPADITGKFTFTITSDDENAPMPKDAQGNPVTQVTNDANGIVDFGDITFSLDDLNKALGYTEAALDDEPAVVKDVVANEQNAEAVANENVVTGSGEQENAAGNDEVALVGENEQLAVDGSEQPAVEGNDAKNVASVAPAESDDQALSEAGIANGLVKVAYADELDPDELKPDKVRTCTFTYTITETGTVAGVTNDAVSSKTVQFKLTDDGDGNFTVERVTPGDVAFTFNNSYSVDPTESSVSDQITFTKVLEGRAQNAGEFAFELLEGNDVVATGTNDAAGVVTFEPVTYTEPGAHRYAVREVGAGATVDGVTYDGTTFQVSTVVSDDGEGGLAVEHALVGADAAVFENAYAASPTSVVIGASKVFKGKDLAEGQFTFKLVGDEVDLEAKNKADGTVVFPALEFDAVGTYDFEMYEVNDGQANVTYDSAKHHVSVVVTDDGKGNLVAEIVGGKDEAMAFTNVYSEPAPSNDPAPSGKTGATVAKTGDNALQLAAGLAIVAFAAASIAFVAKRRRS